MLNKLTSILKRSSEVKIKKIIDDINKKEPFFVSFTDEEIQSYLPKLKARFTAGETLNDLLVDTYALCREASKRVLGMRHFDSQLYGGIVLHNGDAAEMKTGEGKTLVASLSAYLNSCSGEKTYIVTANDYLAERDSNINSPLFSALGLTTACVISKMPQNERKDAYKADIIYSTATQLGFDFLRDSTAVRKDDIIQGELSYAIIDEIDSILIDDARTPLIITHAGTTKNDHYEFFNEIISEFICDLRNKGKDSGEVEVGEGEGALVEIVLQRDDKSCEITELGYHKLENKLIEKGIILNRDELYTYNNLSYIDMLTNAAKARYLFIKNTDYIIHNGKAHIVDQNTGRVIAGRRWSGGLHQAIEAKEAIEIQPDNINDGSISLQNYFRLFKRISGMSGTVLTEQDEFNAIYGMNVFAVPTNKPLIRKIEPDRVYLTAKGKNKAVINEIIDVHKTKRPILVGTQSIEESEYISNVLKEKNILHQLLNASQNEKEALIIADAGKIGAITIATNMAGRGTDIILGGNVSEFTKHIDGELSQDSLEYLVSQANKESALIKSLGGLHVIGTSRSKSRRVDNQLVGRCGRQGEPGSAVIFSSLEDDLLLFFGGEKYISLFRGLGVGDDDCISHSMVDKAIYDAQKKHEGAAVEMRASLVKFDNVSHEQRFHYTSLRNMLLMDTDYIVLNNLILNIIPTAYFESVFSDCVAKMEFPEYWDSEAMAARFSSEINCQINIANVITNRDIFDPIDVKDELFSIVSNHIRKNIIGDAMISNPSHVMHMLMECMHDEWIDNINHLEEIRSAIHLRGYAQKDPLREYKEEAIKRFEIFVSSFQVKFIPMLYKANIREELISKMNEALSEGSQVQE